MATHNATDILRQSSSTRENLSLLSLMEALAAGERVTQRDLARVTGLNLKKEPRQTRGQEATRGQGDKSGNR